MGKGLFIPKEKLKKVRTALGIKQSIFAEKVAMDQAQYSRRETGKVAISDKEWERFAKELGVSKEEIYETDPQIVNIVNNTDNKDSSINAFEITIKAPNKFFEELHKKMDLIINKLG